MSYIINIPPIENDELMSSYFRRMATANGFTDPILFMQAYIWPNSMMNRNQNRTIRDDGFNTLVNFNRCFGDDASAIRFFIETSLFPGIRPVISNADAIILYVFRDNTDDIEIIPKRFVQDVKYCPVCVQNDMESKGFTWFRRSHNMPGVSVCYKHRCHLHVAKNGQKTNTTQATASDIDSEYAEFAHSMLEAAIDCNNKQTIEAIKNRITDLGYNIPTGGYTNYYMFLCNSGLKDFMSVNTEYILKARKKNIVNSETCETMLKLLFVLFKTPDNFKQYITYNKTFAYKGYDILEYNDGLFGLHHRCGEQFVVTQELFDKGWKCPCCKNIDKNENIAVHIAEACRYQYEIVNISGTMTTLRHKKCGQQHDFSIAKFVLGNTRCACERRKEIDDAKKDIEAIKGFKLIEFKGVNQHIKIKHQACKNIFDVGYYSFISAPFCRACLKNKIGVDIKITPRPINKSSEISFIQELSEITGDEYTFIGPYNGDKEYTYVRHNKCGIIERYIPVHFRQGVRCKHCKVKTSYEGFSKYVHDLTDGEYEIVDRGKSQYLIIKNTITGDEYSLLKSVIMQELNRVQPSRILPVRYKRPVDIAKYSLRENKKNQILSVQHKESANIAKHSLRENKKQEKKNSASVYNIDIAWEYIQNHFAQTDFFGNNDININNAGLRILAQSGKIKEVMARLYTFPENNVTAIEVIKYKYFEKNGNRLGHWFGQSFAYELGLIDKPKTVYITSNKMHASKRYDFTVLGQPVVLRKPIMEITDDNYKILAVIDYLTTYKNGFRGMKHINKEREITALRNYIGDITREQFTVYADQCTDKEKLDSWLDLIYEHGLFARIQNKFSVNELFHPDDLNATDVEMLTLVKAGKLKKIYKRLYTFPDNDVTISDIAEYKYIKHHNTLLGYWYGESFMHFLGVCEKPEKMQITSSAFSGSPYRYREAEERHIEEYGIRLRKPLAEITDENYKILCIVDFISEYGMGKMNKTYFYPYKHINLEALLPALREYLSDIDKSAFDKYLYLVKNVETFGMCLDLIYTYPELEKKISNFKKNAIFSASDVGYSVELLWAYTHTGKIKNVYEGLFAKAKADVMDEDIINYHYRIRNDIRIGYWFGKSFAYHLGLIEKPDEYNIVSNTTADLRGEKRSRGKRKRSERGMLGHKITLRSPIAPITEDNYKVLCVIDYTTTYRRAFYYSEHIDVDMDVAALREYLCRIPRIDFKQYEDLCESKKLLNEWLDRIYGAI